MQGRNPFLAVKGVPPIKLNNKPSFYLTENWLRKLVDAFRYRNRKLAGEVSQKLKNLGIAANYMHVCGTHQDTLVRFGLDQIFSEAGIKVIQGPGCPVCVTTPLEIEEAISLARTGKLITTFGDLLRVPGEKGSLEKAKTERCDVRIIYSVDDAVRIALKNPKKEVVFLAVGFETTAPSTANVLLSDPPGNFSVLNCHRRIPPALKTILEMGDVMLDGIIQPGHVSTIIGTKSYEFISEKYHLPQVVAGFEPLDMLVAVYMLARQTKERRAEVENEYLRGVSPEGNLKAKEILKRVFEPGDIKWRGFPIIPGSYLSLKRRFDGYDAAKKFEDSLSHLKDREFGEPPGCRCGEVLRGLITPVQCPLFGRACNPENPVGPCMVSAEGSCQIEYKWRGGSSLLKRKI